MAIKTVLGHVIIWCDDSEEFDPAKITNIRDDDLEFWGEVQEIKPPVECFSDGETTKKCKWYDARIITNKEKEKLSPPQLFGGRAALSRFLDNTPENVSFRWKFK
jgi:hypothetical protein